MNVRKITFETDVQRLRKIREELCNLDLNKSLEPRETEDEEGLMDEIRVLFDVIKNSDKLDLDKKYHGKVELYWAGLRPNAYRNK